MVNIGQCDIEIDFPENTDMDLSIYKGIFQNIDINKILYQ